MSHSVSSESTRVTPMPPQLLFPLFPSGFTFKSSGRVGVREIQGTNGYIEAPPRTSKRVPHGMTQDRESARSGVVRGLGSRRLPMMHILSEYIRGGWNGHCATKYARLRHVAIQKTSVLYEPRRSPTRGRSILSKGGP